MRGLSNTFLVMPSGRAKRPQPVGREQPRSGESRLEWYANGGSIRFIHDVHPSLLPARLRRPNSHERRDSLRFSRPASFRASATPGL